MHRHVDIVHNQIKKLKCYVCGKEFGLDFNLKVHVDQVHNKIKAYSCDICMKSFTHGSSRDKHIDEVHLKKRVNCTWYGCTWAGSKYEIKYHVRRAHTWEWSIECDICDEKGVWWGCIFPSEFQKHKMKCHPEEFAEEEKKYAFEHPHVCKIIKCQKRFKTAEECKRHLRKLH